MNPTNPASPVNPEKLGSMLFPTLPAKTQQPQAPVPAAKRELPAVVRKLQEPEMLSEIGKRLPVAVAKTLPPQMVLSLMLDQCRRIPALLECHPTSIVNALYQCASMGLPLDGYHAHLIPFGKDATLIVDWKGYTAIANRYGIRAKATLVCENDDFAICEDDGSGRTTVRHTWDIRQDRGAVVGAYSRAVEAGKDPDYEFMSVSEILEIRNRSLAFQRKKGPWLTDPGEMMRKTVIRRHRKRWPILSPELAVADEVESQDYPAIEVVPPKFEALPETTTPPAPATPAAEPPKRGPGRPRKNPLPETATATPETTPPADPETDLTAVRRLCGESQIEECDLVQYLKVTGEIDETLMSLEDVRTISPVSLATVRKHWAEIKDDPELKAIMES